MGHNSTGQMFFEHLTLIKWLGEYQGPPIPSEEIARQMCCHWATARVSMQTLEKLGMVKQVRSEHDKRMVAWVPLYSIKLRESEAEALAKVRGLTAPGATA